MSENTSHDISITALSILREPTEANNGSTILAYFDCGLTGVHLIGCALARTKNRGLVAYGPVMSAKGQRRASVAFTDDSLRHAVMTAARDVYRAMGGKNAEWEPSALNSEMEAKAQ
jgi:hypothetical protein